MTEPRLYQVQRPLQVSTNHSIPAGEIVDGSAWPVDRIPKLIDQHYIVPVVVLSDRAPKQEVRRGR